MQFIDHTGHVFSLPHYYSYPTGYQYNENPYVFWLKNNYGDNLSVDCIYIEAIRPIIPDEKIASVKISCESNHYKLISSKTINDKISKSKSVFEIDLDFYTNDAEEYNKEHNTEFTNDFKSELLTIVGKDNNDVLLIENLYKQNWFYKDENQRLHQFIDIYNLPEADENGNRTIVDPDDGNTYLLTSKDTHYTMIPFYVVACNVKDPGAWLTNVLIEVLLQSGETLYCPITIGGTFVDEEEALIINGRNIGLNLPKEICKAIYDIPFSTDYAELSVWNKKIKEYLINHIKLRAERGNYDSALKSLKWFGWGDRIELSALIQTDNEYLDQYILDKFDLNFDVINEFRYFRNSTLLNLYFRGVVENKEDINDYNFENEFYGEGKPNTIDLFDKIEEEFYDESDIPFYKPYYIWTFNEIALKLSALKYYYQKYFLPIHLNVFHSSVTNQTFANNIKFTNSAKTLICERPIYINDNIKVEFGNGYDKIWLSDETRYIDIIDENKQFDIYNSNWIEYPGGKHLENANKYSDYYVFEIDDNCFSVPIKFSATDINHFYNCVLFCYKYENDNRFVKLKEEFYRNYFENNKTVYYYDGTKMVTLRYTNNFDYVEDEVQRQKLLDVEFAKFYEQDIFYDTAVCLKESHFNFYAQNKESVINFILYPKLVNKNFDINYWLDSNFEIELYVNNTWYHYKFRLAIPELDIEMHKLEYKYDSEVCKQFIGFEDNKPKFNAFMYVPQLVTISNINFINDYINYMKNSYMYEVSPNNQVFKNNVYYYYYDKDGRKIILSSGKFVLWENPNTGKFNLVRRDILDIIRNMSQEEIDEVFPLLERYICYDGNDYDGIDPEHKRIIEELMSNIQLDNGHHNREDLVDIPDGVTLYSSVYKNIFSLIDLYNSNINVPKNLNYFNKIHLFEIKRLNENNEFENIPYIAEEYSKNNPIELNISGLDIIKFGDNDSEAVKDLYDKFFDIETGTWSKPMFVKDKKSNNWVQSYVEQSKYDFYLMHDNDIWYGIMISRDTIADNDFEMKNTVFKLSDEIYMKYVRSDEKMLINRMDLVDMKNVYHFKTDDMIVAKLNNYVNIPFKLIAGSKWVFTPCGVDANITEIVESNNNFALMSMKDSKFKRTPGYYSVRVSYSIDNFINHSQERETKFLVKD